jgi:hypothetical protein
METLMPFTKWNGKRPCVEESVWIDLTEPAKKPGAGEYHPNHFTFFRTKIAQKKGGMFGLGGSDKEAGYTLLRVTYRARLSRRHAKEGIYVLRRDVEEVEVDGGGSSGTDRVSPSFSGPRDTDDGKLYKSFYFKRLVISVHDAPEAGIEGGTSSPSAPTTSGQDPVRLDRLFFARVLIAGAAAGSGTRRIKETKGGKRIGRGQKVDLLVNLIHLDGVTDRFRTRSLAMNWNMEMPKPGEK